MFSRARINILPLMTLSSKGIFFLPSEEVMPAYVYWGLRLPGMILSVSPIIFSTSLRGKHWYYHHFTSEKCEAKQSYLFKVTQLVRGGGAIPCRWGPEPKFLTFVFCTFLGHNRKNRDNILHGSHHPSAPGMNEGNYSTKIHAIDNCRW